MSIEGKRLISIYLLNEYGVDPLELCILAVKKELNTFIIKEKEEEMYKANDRVAQLENEIAGLKDE